MTVDQEATTAAARMRARVTSADRGAGAAAHSAAAALVEAVGNLADAAIDRVLLTDERVTSAAEAKRSLAGDEDTEALAGKIQRVAVLAVPLVRVLARGARFTRVPWVLVASTAFSIASTLRAGVREVQVIGSLIAHRIEQDAKRAGYPVKVPVVDIVEIGAGGGSIAWLDQIGTLRVGPRSAGAVPGPASYTQGGTEATVTDANLLLGRINPGYFLGGEMPLSVEQARKATAKLAAKLEMSVDGAARGIVRLANANMVNAIKLVSVRKGHDPREYTLVAFGGGGPMHATALARELHIRKVVIPPAPGEFSAWGMLTTDYKQDFTRTTVLRATDETMSQVYRRYDELERDAMLFFKHEGFDPANVVTARAADMRYGGQEHTVRVPVPDGQPALGDVTARFHERHESAFMFRIDGPVEFVNLHLTGLVRVPNPDLTAFAPAAARGNASKGRRKVDFDEDGIHDAALYERARLGLDEEVKGPAIVEEEASTTVIYPGQRARLDRIGNLVIETGV